MEYVPDKPDNPDDKQPLPLYFLPGRIVLHIEHPAGLTQAFLARAIARFLSEPPKEHQQKGQSEQSKEPRWKEQIEPPKPESILTFPLKDNKGFVLSIVPARMRDENASQDELVDLLVTIYNDLAKEPLLVSGNITLNTIAPDWLMGGAHHGTGTGGPGGWPVEAPAPNGDSWKFRLQFQQGNVTQLPFADGQGAEVCVAILDTAPSVHELVRAYHDWDHHHPLIETLLGPQGRLHVYPATDADLHPLMHYSLIGHRYWMPDHGMFIAGIIHTIAPMATLHLYEVLNPYGVGSFETIAQGLLRILENPDIGRPLIINCSFTLGLPPVAPPNFPDKLRGPEMLKHIRASFEEIFNRLSKQVERDGCLSLLRRIFARRGRPSGGTRDDVVIVAAAGNDASPNSRPDAGYPASFFDVLGVGALPKGATPANGQYRAATYSNLSDTPSKTGFMTLGGEPGSGQGILGVYINEFPIPPSGGGSTFTPDTINYQRNTTGWAWWAGTSFATPIISGILASWRSQPGNRAGSFQFPNAQQALNRLSQPIKTNEDEKVIFVMQ